MIRIAPRMYGTIKACARRLRVMHDDFRMQNFMYSLPEDIRKDIGWPDFKADRCTRSR